MPLLKVKGQRVNYDVDTFVGRPGTLFYGPDDGIFRLSDGETPGGILLSAGGGGDGSGYVLPTATTTVKGGVKVDGTTISIANQVISVGSIAYSKISDPPTIPTNTNQLTNGAGFITTAALASYALTANVPTNTNQLTNGAGFITSSALSGLATETYVTTRGYITSAALSDYALTENVPTDINQLTDASGLLAGGGGSGSDGIGISNVAVNESGRLIITYTDDTTVDAGYVIGPQGEQGIQGDTGAIGPQGPQGIQGETGPQGETGSAGADGVDGASTYEIAVSNGFSGNESAWLASLVGPQGDPGPQGDTGDQGPQGDPGINGTDGVGISTASIDGSGNLIITLTDTSTINTGNVYANTGNITFATTTIDTADSSGITFTPAVAFNSDLTVENDLIVRNQIRTVAGDIFATESFVQQAVNQLIGAAPEALNTLQELAQALGNDENFATTILNAVSASTNTVRYDINNQNLTEQQKQNARTNIGAVSDADLYAASIVMG